VRQGAASGLVGSRVLASGTEIASRHRYGMICHYHAVMAQTYRTTFSTFGWISWSLVLIVTGSVVLASPKGLGAASLVLALIASFIEAFFVQMARCGVSAGPDGLIVRQPFSRVDVPWPLVDHIEVDQAGALTISLSSGAEIPVYGFGGSVIGMITKGVHARRARDGLLAARRVAPAGQSGYSPATSRTAIYWKWAVTTALVLEAAALTGLLTH
jgi:Bacterial PH domain